VRALAAQDAWIIEGNYARTLPLRLARADHVILLDVPRVQCMYRVVRRGLTTRGRSRPDLAKGCREQWPELSFLRWIWRFPVDEVPPMLGHLHACAAAGFTVTRLSASQVVPFLAQVAGGRGVSTTVASRDAT
jgi:adenylate kinase family enzyme